MQAGAAQPSGDAAATWQQYQQPSTDQQQDEVKTLWIGDLQYWMDENYLWSCMGPSGEVRGKGVRRGTPSALLEGIVGNWDSSWIRRPMCILQPVCLRLYVSHTHV